MGIGICAGFFGTSFIMQRHLGTSKFSSSQNNISVSDNTNEKFSSLSPQKSTRFDLYGRVWKIDKTTGTITLIRFDLPDKLPGKIIQEPHFFIIQTDQKTRKIVFVHSKKGPDGNFVNENGSLNDIKEGEKGSFIHRIIFHTPTTGNDPLVEFRYSDDSPFKITSGLTTAIKL